MQIHNECTFLKPDGIAKVENMYNAKYVFESCIEARAGDWANFPAAIFYTEEKHPEGSNYFALYKDPYSDRFMITNGFSATKPFQGLKIGDDVIYSRYRHDYREFNGAMVDGGRDYFKHSLAGEPVTIRVNKDRLEVV